MDTKEQLVFLTGSSKILLQLAPETLPMWGKMTAQHMVEHLSSAIVMSLKKTTYNPQLNQEAVLKSKTYMLSHGLKPGNILDDGKLKDLKTPDLDTAINEYSNQLNNFLHAIETSTLATYHIYFGQLNNDEWLTFHYWHTQHHFNQFGLI